MSGALGRRLSFIVLALLLLGLTCPTTTKADSTVTFSGQATAVRATVLGITTVISDTGPLPSSGGAEQASLLSANVPGLLTANVLHATTIGQGDASDSHASVADLDLTVGGNGISASLLVARALARCMGPGAPAISGTSQVVGLTINGVTIAVSGQPNQTIALPNGRVVINEQQSSLSGPTGGITVNALHIVVNALADVVISSAHADIACAAAPVCVGDDFEVGEGDAHDSNTGDEESFAFAGGTKKNQDGSSWGHMEFIRYGRNPLKVHATRITKFVKVDATTRHIEGLAEVNGVPGYLFAVDATDNHKLGRRDVFGWTLSNGERGGNQLDNGDVEIEEPCDP